MRRLDLVVRAAKAPICVLLIHADILPRDVTSDTRRIDADAVTPSGPPIQMREWSGNVAPSAPIQPSSDCTSGTRQKKDFKTAAVGFLGHGTDARPKTHS